MDTNKPQYLREREIDDMNKSIKLAQIAYLEVKDRMPITYEEFLSNGKQYSADHEVGMAQKQAYLVYLTRR